MRMLACITIQPHVKNKLTPQKLLPLTWDSRKSKKAKTEHITAKEAEEKRKQIIALLGDKY